MIGPDYETGMTFGELGIELAVEVNLADYTTETDGSASLPLDPESRRIILQAVNEGLQDFARANPRWTKLQQRVQLTLDPAGTGPLNVDKDPGRYRLPKTISSRPKAGWKFIDSSSVYRHIPDCSMDLIRDYQNAQGDATGTPTAAAVQFLPSKEAGLSGRRGMEAVFFPKPDTAHVVEAEFRINVARMTDVDERHPFGQEHDQAILKCAVEAFRRRDEEDPGFWERAAADKEKAIADSIALDRENMPRRLGTFHDPSVRSSGLHPRQYAYQGVTSYSGVDVVDGPY